MTEWLKEGMSLQWFAQSEWKNYELKQLAAHDSAGEEGYAAELEEVQVHVQLRHVPERSSADRRVREAEVTVRPGRPGAALSGVRVLLPIDQALACTWKPHLSPEEDMAVGDKMFRSPAIVFENEERMTALVPDLVCIEQERFLPHIMDYTEEGHRLMYGLCSYEETGHVYHKLQPAAEEMTAPVTFRFYLVEWDKAKGQRDRDYRAVEQFLWEAFAKTRMPMEDETNVLQELEPYVDYAYGWALDRWKDVTWQQFTLENQEVGGVVFLVCSWQKPGHGREDEWREPKSLWNQAWFCGLRTAYGYALWGRQQGREDWVRKSELALNFALSAPQQDGLFPGYFQAGDDNRWESGRWHMSGPRRPAGHEAYVHLLDSSWTCYWLLKWHRDVEADMRILPYVRSYVDRLLRLQREDGSFPAWVDPAASGISPYLLESPETSMHIMLLLLLHELEPDSRYVAASERAAGMVMMQVVQAGRWEDFETYWSCSKSWEHKQYGVRDPRSGLYNQCNFGMYWTAEALKDLYKATGASHWLDAGEQVLAEASLYQQIWQPAFFPVPTLGGFGVMNSDDEWNDARQSLFALTYLEYYRLTGRESYRARALWAMRASFYMMYCPLNPSVSQIYESVHPQFNEQDYGFHMENFNHHDGTPVGGLGEFTIFDWGCGAASTSLMEFGRAVSLMTPSSQRERSL
ncbi:hypothetical protein ACFOQM_14505 [Paenibacillus sp. GCM10012307]|uniref:Uncharacterized protein n=1 Tax=Paenibacillus roseus TaxID=2798579 RepID=A0A934J393_9BACL|nr:hypothetical protein [Paenibacillus roseus]MBJ6362474.1 hypothetical protein [Paenibacillus roseus]